MEQCNKYDCEFKAQAVKLCETGFVSVARWHLYLVSSSSCATAGASG